MLVVFSGLCCSFPCRSLICRDAIGLGLQGVDDDRKYSVGAGHRNSFGRFFRRGQPVTDPWIGHEVARVHGIGLYLFSQSGDQDS